MPIIESELSGFESPTSQLFSQNAPYCGADLTPKFNYDLEKAQRLNCPIGCTLDFLLQEGNSVDLAIEDDIRAEEAAGRFGERFIELARAVYVTNDRRAELKKKINLATGSELVEEKSYEDYTGKG